MLNNFFGYIKPKEEEIKAVWKEAAFTFDANILLNFYRYRTDTTRTFLDLIEKVQDRVWLTNQSVQEYFNNRLIVISEQEKTYSDLKESLFKNIEEPLNNQRKHPYVGQELLDEFKTVSSKLKSELDLRSQEYSKKLGEDEILQKIIELFDNKVTIKFDEEKLNRIYTEGDKRYNADIPPGFKDKNKGGTRQYGDLVLWFQILELGKQINKDIIFITDDEKEDWLQIHKGRTIGMLPLLQIEFNKETSRKAYIYNAQKFIEELSKLFDTKITEETIAEIKTLREENRLVLELIELMPKLELSAEEIDNYIKRGIISIADKNGWAELAKLGLYLVRNTPVNYRNFGFSSLKNFIQSREIYEIKHERVSPNARNVDTAYVREK